jgi:hypothetical protein
MACDAATVPVVTGDIYPTALDDLVRLCVQLGKLHHHPGASPVNQSGDANGTGTVAPGPAASPAGETLKQAIIGKAMISHLVAYRDGATWLVAVEGSSAAAEIILGAGGIPGHGHERVPRHRPSADPSLSSSSTSRKARSTTSRPVAASAAASSRPSIHGSSRTAPWCPHPPTAPRPAPRPRAPRPPAGSATASSPRAPAGRTGRPAAQQSSGSARFTVVIVTGGRVARWA